MSNRWIHLLVILAVGYALGYYFRSVGNMTLAKIYPSS